ncbi:hypothetical protein TURU_103831 [Turdus rufiventris]|nr:hypothetical protein TURU_103831 [Turdus rufiventris]
MCDMIDSQSAEKISRMKKLRRTLSESFGRIALKKEDSSFDEGNSSEESEDDNKWEYQMGISAKKREEVVFQAVHSCQL